MISRIMMLTSGGNVTVAALLGNVLHADAFGTYYFSPPVDGVYSFAGFGHGGTGGHDYAGNGGGGGGSGALAYVTANLLTTDVIAIELLEDCTLSINGAVVFKAGKGGRGTSGNTDRAGTGGAAGLFWLYAHPKVVTSGGIKGNAGQNGGWRSTNPAQGGAAPDLISTAVNAGQLVPGGSVYAKGGNGAGGYPSFKTATSPGKHALRIIWGDGRIFPDGDLSVIEG